MAKNQVNITVASYNYLSELSAIPGQTREEYLNKLLTRKSSASQKNVILLKYLNTCISENRISGWNPQTICRQTGISMNALYIHKSRLLAGLRKHYFKWDELEHKIESVIDKKYSGISFYKDEEKTIELMLIKAREMSDAGMMSEAKDMYLQLEKVLRKTNTEQETRFVILSEIYEYCAYYYFYRRNKKRLLFFAEKLSHIFEIIKVTNVRVSEHDKKLLMIRICYSKLYLFFLKWYSSPAAQPQEDYVGIIYSLSKEIKNWGYHLRIIHNKAIMELTRGDNESAKNTILEGCRTAKRLKKRAELNTFSCMLLYVKAKTAENNINSGVEEILNFYNELKRRSPANIWTVYLENALVQFYYPEKKKEMFEILRQLVNSNVLQGDYSFAVYWRFHMDSEEHYRRLHLFFKRRELQTGAYLELEKISKDLLNDIERTCLNTSCYNKELNEMGFLWEVYKLQLIAFVFDEENFNYDRIMMHISKMQQMTRKKKKISGVRTFHLITTCIKMLEFSDNPRNMLSKFELKFKKNIDDMKNDPAELSIIDYAIVSSIARRLKCREITNIARDFYLWLKATYPGVLAPVSSEKEFRESMIYTIKGAEAAA